MARRRGRGEGSITQRPDGRWVARVDLGWQNGKRRRKAIYGKTRRAVADELPKALQDARHGLALSDERQTVAQFAKRWLEDVARARVRPLTFRSYENAVTKYIEPHFRTRKLSQLTPAHVQAWLSALERDGVTAARRFYLRSFLRNVLNTAMRWRLILRNAAALADVPRTTTHEFTLLTPEQAQARLKAVKGDPLEAFVTVGLSCGLRRGEMLGLQWPDVDLDQGVLHVRHALQRFGGDGAKRRPLLEARKRLRKALADDTLADAERQAVVDELSEVRAQLRELKTSLQLVEPKSMRSRRTITLPTVAVTALKAQRVRQLEARLAAGEDWQDQRFVFTTAIGTPLEPRRLTREFRALLKQAELPLIRLHDLRHSCATLLLGQGVSPRVVMEVLGHSQVSLTLNTYSHVLPALQQDAARKMDAILFRGGK
jgi:integrase